MGGIYFKMFKLSKMINCKDEFLDLVNGAGGFEKLICARIFNGRSYVDEQKEFLLPQYFTNWEYEKFLEEIDFKYDDGYGGQELFGTVWFSDNMWAEREEYDGSEWWALKQYPAIPVELLKQ